jgi:hypothetical protein
MRIQAIGIAAVLCVAAMAQEIQGIAVQGRTFEFISAGPHLDTRVVKGAPYAAEGETEFRQTLADGTQIKRQSSSKVARDRQGRTRTENSLGMIGPWMSEGKAPQVVAIHDPVAKETIILNHNDKTAHRMKMPERYRVDEHVVVRGGMFNRKIDGKEEKLGTQTIEGVQAEGTRVTHTIAAGEIGNDRPLTTVTERWYSPELQVVVMSRTDDPQHGETTYRLSNIRRGEPDKSLFEIPAGYTVKEGPGEMHLEHRIEGGAGVSGAVRIERRIEKK